MVNARSNQREAEAVAREARDPGSRHRRSRRRRQKGSRSGAGARALSEFGRVDILINNVRWPHKPFTETTDADWS